MPRTLVRNLVGVAGFLSVWEVFGRSGVLPQKYFPPPSTVLATLARLLVNPEFGRHLVATLLAWAIGVGISVAVAVPAGLVLGNVRLLRLAAGAIIEFLRPIPAIAWWPLVFVILGGGPQTKITLAVYASVWPILFNIIYALGEIDRQFVETARSFGLSRLRIALFVRLPDMLPFALTGIRISVTFALLVTVSTELVFGGVPGLGTYVISYGEESGRMDIVLATAVLVGLLGYLGNGLLAALQKHFVVWSPGES
ncbi:ABC transporter permease [Actinocrispum wychmicini]|uniref:NitT/TauT family transport system permease protein n=1 Tax=Actinocrispum wychmicini TaxID=1213861 RepID=A0A4V6NNZ2_9PSEU|nr:ABC transporter permease subunit [Actinocrispum wychmicini]TCO60720.1 NitT/TauT family transport system permease protein [Actinocrispum wychmicini]